MDRPSKIKINKETQALNDTFSKMGLIDIYRTLHPKTTEYTFFSSAHGTFSRIEPMLGTKQVFINLILKSHQASFLTTVI